MASVAPVAEPTLALDDIQGDILQGLQKNIQQFLFFKIVDVAAFKAVMQSEINTRITSARLVANREALNAQRKKYGEPVSETWIGLNVSFTKDGLDQLLGAGRPQLLVTKATQPPAQDGQFEVGAAAAGAALFDNPSAQWVPGFISDRIDGLFMVTAPDDPSLTPAVAALKAALGASVTIVYPDIGIVRPDEQKGHEHFGFLDGVSQPGVRGLTAQSNPITRSDEGLPGQDLIWPGEFVFGYPAEDPTDSTAEGVPPTISVPWMANGSFLVFRRLEQKVPEFHSFVEAQAQALGMTSALLSSRMMGRWPSGAPVELTPMQDDIALAGDIQHNNDFSYGTDVFERLCPYAAHIRKAYPRDDIPSPIGGEKAAAVRRIMRQGIPFGPEVGDDETVTTQSRGLMFLCYQTSIAGQFEFIQKNWVNNPDFVFGKKRVDGTAVVPGHDPIIGQVQQGARFFDEPIPNYPTGNLRSTLNLPDSFVVLTAAAYLFVPSLSALNAVLT